MRRLSNKLVAPDLIEVVNFTDASTPRLNEQAVMYQQGSTPRPDRRNNGWEVDKLASAAISTKNNMEYKLKYML